MSSQKTAEEVKADITNEVDKAQASLSSAAKDASSKAEDFKSKAKGKFDDLSSAAQKEVDDFKKSLPEREEEVKNFFQKIYKSVSTTATSFYTSVKTTIQENPVATSQVFLAAAIGTVAYFGKESGKFKLDFKDPESKKLVAAIGAAITALDGLAITLYNKKK